MAKKKVIVRPTPEYLLNQDKIKITVEQEGHEPCTLECDVFVLQAANRQPDGILKGHILFNGQYEELARLYLGLGRNIHENVFGKTIEDKPAEPAEGEKKE